MATHLVKNGVQGIEPVLERQIRIRDLWQTPGLLLSQCCGPDLFTAEGAQLRVIARPAFSQLDCSSGCYYSHIVSRQQQPQSVARIAVNAVSSRSGFSALVEWMEARNIEVSNTVMSGSHVNSLSMLHNDHADLAAIDAHLVNQFKIPIDLPVIGRSGEALSPPFVFHRATGVDRELLFEALAHAIRLHGSSVGIESIIKCDRLDYAGAGMAALTGRKRGTVTPGNTDKPGI